MKKTIFLIGFMGVGKTTLGKRLGAKCGLQFLDLDELIVQHAGLSIHDLIIQHGEEYFRVIESQVLRSVNVENTLLSTGGGCPCYHHNMDWMKEHGITLWLDLDEKMILSRLKTTDLSQRPLLKGMNEESLATFIHHKLAERLPYYKQAQIRYHAMQEDLESLLERLMPLLH